MSSVYVSREMLDFAGTIDIGQDDEIDVQTMVGKLDHIFTMSVSRLAMYKNGMEKDLEKILENSSEDYKILVKVNESSDKLMIYHRENGAQSEMVIISYSNPDGGNIPSGSYTNNAQVYIVVLVGDITAEIIGKMISGDGDVSENGGE